MSEEPWRDTVPEATADDLETLLGTGIGAAREQLERHGGFLPFALVVESEGEVRMLAVAPPEPDTSGTDNTSDFDADAMIGDLTQLLRQNRHDFRASALVCDITLVEEGSDAIHVATEHQDGSVFAAVLPYRPAADHEGWDFGELAADGNEPAIWVD